MATYSVSNDEQGFCVSEVPEMGFAEPVIEIYTTTDPASVDINVKMSKANALRIIEVLKDEYKGCEGLDDQ